MCVLHINTLLHERAMTYVGGVKRQSVAVSSFLPPGGSFLPPCGSAGMNLGCWTRQQTPLATHRLILSVHQDILSDNGFDVFALFTSEVWLCR